VRFIQYGVLKLGFVPFLDALVYLIQRAHNAVGLIC